MTNKYIQFFRRGRAIRKALGGDNTANFATYKQSGNTRTYTPKTFNYSADDTNAILRLHNNWGPNNDMSWDLFLSYVKTGYVPKTDTSEQERQDLNATFTNSPATESDIINLEKTIQAKAKDFEINTIDPTTAVTTPNTSTTSLPSKKLVSKTKLPVVHDDKYFINKANNQLKKWGITDTFKTIDLIKAFLRSIGVNDDGDFGNATRNKYRSLINSGAFMEDGIVKKKLPVKDKYEVSQNFYDGLSSLKSNKYVTGGGVTFVKALNNGTWYMLDKSGELHAVYTAGKENTPHP